MNGYVEGNDTKKRPTTVIQKLNELQISDSEPEVKKRKEMSSENIRRGAHDDSVDEIPSHVCGQGDIGQGEILFDDGKFDPLLRWPVVGCATISILSQLRVGRETVRHSFKTDVASLSYHRQRRVGRETVRHSFKTDVASLSYHRPTTDMNQASGVVQGDLNWIFHPSLHGIRSAVPSPPSYLTDVMCYIVTGLTDVHCPFSKSHLQTLVAKTPRKFLTKVRDRRLSEEKRSWLMYQEPLRRKTFLVNWPHNGSLSAKRMSQAGFYHSGGFDRVRCVFCGVRISHWKVGADPLREHAKSVSLCWFVQFFHKRNTESAIDHPTNELQAPDQESHAPSAP